MKTKEQVLIEQIKKASSEYYTTGKSFLSDAEFDNLVEELEKINPNAEILSKREIHNSDWNYQLENLPYKLYSIKKIKTFKEIQNWISFVKNKLQINEDFEVCLTPKFDGIKLVHYHGNFYTRYEDGERGYNVTSRIKNSVVVNDSENYEGELIISKTNFKSCSGYTSSRNFIPAIFSSKNRLKDQDKVEYIKYSIYGVPLDKDKQIRVCNQINKVCVPYTIYKASELTEEKIIKFYFNALEMIDFECDGVVIDINSSIYRQKLGETQKYLDCCRAYKGDALFDDIKESEIIDIIWQMSRYGKLTPVAKINPVIINEGEVKNVSLYNADYIKQNNIYIGQKIQVTRKGKINPKIVNFLTYEKLSNLPEKCPFCGNSLSWNESEIDLVCDNKNCKEKQSQQIYYFFKTVGVQNFGLESVKIYIQKGFELKDFFDKEKILSTQVEGIGLISKQAFLSELDILKKGVALEKIQEASGCFPGLGSSTLKILNTLNLDLEYLYIDSYYNEKFKKGLTLEGIGKLSLESYFEGIYDFCDFYYNSFLSKEIPLVKKEKCTSKSEKFKNFNIVFTGFRNEEWKEKIEKEGGKVLTSLSSTCNLLVVKDINSTSSKTKKAKELGIKIISIKDFEQMI